MAVSVHKWLLNKFRDINHSRMDKHIDIIAKNSGKSKAYIKFDIIRNFLIRGTGYTDYFRCDFINLSAKEKKNLCNCKKLSTKFLNISTMRNISSFFVTSLFLTSFSKSISKEISSTFAQAVRKISRSSLTAEKPFFCKRSDRRGRSRHFKNHRCRCKGQQQAL